MKHGIVIFFIYFLFAGSLSGQFVSAGFRLGIGTYSMGELNELQSARISESGLPLKTMESYPASPNYRVEVAYNGIKFINKLGLFYVFNSTGARSTITDYSGRADLDAIINGSQIGLTAEHNLYKVSNFEFCAYIEGSFISTRLKTEDKIEIYPVEYSSSIKHEFVSQGFTTEPGVSLQYYILKFLRLKINLGYLMDFSGPLHSKDKVYEKIVLDGEEVNPDWSGLRAGFQMDFLFK